MSTHFTPILWKHDPTWLLFRWFGQIISRQKKHLFPGKLKATPKMAAKFGVGKWYYKLPIGWLQIADNIAALMSHPWIVWGLSCSHPRSYGIAWWSSIECSKLLGMTSKNPKTLNSCSWCCIAAIVFWWTLSKDGPQMSHAEKPWESSSFKVFAIFTPPKFN